MFKIELVYEGQFHGNIKSIDYTSIPNQKVTNSSMVTNSINGFNKDYMGSSSIIVGEYVFGETTNQTFGSEKYDGIMVYSQNGLTLYIEYEEIVEAPKAVFIFDRTMNQYPRTCTISTDGKQDVTLRNETGTTWSISMPYSAKKFKIVFNDWTISNYVKCITYIGNDNRDIVLDKRFIDSLSITHQILPSESEISYGLIGDFGSVEANDLNDYISNAIKQNYISRHGGIVRTKINDSLYSEQVIDGSFYNKKTRISKNDYTSLLNAMDSIRFRGMPLRRNATLKEVFLYVFNSYFKNNNYFFMYDSESMFDNITYASIYLPESTYREAFDKICEVAQCAMFYFRDTFYIFPFKIDVQKFSSSIANIPLYHQYSDFDSNQFVENDYKTVELTECAISEKLYKSVEVYSQEIKSVNIYNTNEDKDSEIFVQSSTVVQFRNYIYKREGFTNVNVVIPKKNFYETEEIRKIYKGRDSDGNPNISAIVNYTHEMGKRYGYLNINGGMTVGNHTMDFNPSSIKVEDSYSESDEIEEVITGSKKYQDNRANANITEDEDNYYLSLIIIVESYVESASPTSNTIVQGNKLNAVSNYESKSPKSMTISFKGNVFKVLFDFNDKTYGEESDRIAYFNKENELLQDGQTFADNILNEYFNGKKTASVQIGFENYYNDYGELVIGKNEHLITCGDLMRIEGEEENAWIVTACELTYDGCPFLNVALLEI